MRMKNLPNYLTCIRILGSVILPIILLYNADVIGCLIALNIFIICSITDYFDGYLARLMKHESSFGKMLDPIADKLLVIMILVALPLVYKDSYTFALGIPSIIIISREILVSGIREFFGSSTGTFSVTKMSKFKTTTQMISIMGLLAFNIPIFNIPLVFTISTVLLWLAALFAMITAFSYVNSALKLLRNDKR